jgi:hypothetical protein
MQGRGLPDGVLATEDWEKKVSAALDCEQTKMLHIECRGLRGCAAWLHGNRKSANLPDEYFWLLHVQDTKPSISLAGIHRLDSMIHPRLSSQTILPVASFLVTPHAITRDKTRKP